MRLVRQLEPKCAGARPAPSPGSESMHVSAITEIDPRTGIALQLCRLLAQILTLQVRTKGCHWHVTGASFRSLHALFDEQAKQLSDIADEVAERTRALGL